MNSEEIYKARFDALHACVLIPTYNNQATIAHVISDVSAYCNSIIVVNDGATDETPIILKSFTAIKLVSFEKK